MTNDLGEFRVYGLEPGVFYIGVATLNTVAGIDRPGAMIYAPGVASLSDAQRIAVGLSQNGVGHQHRRAADEDPARIAGIALRRQRAANHRPDSASSARFGSSFRAISSSVPVGSLADSSSPTCLRETTRLALSTQFLGRRFSLEPSRRSRSTRRTSRMFVSLRSRQSGRAAPRDRPVRRSAPSRRRPIMFDPVDPSLSSFGLFMQRVPIGTDLAFSTHVFAVRMKVNVQQLPQGWMLKAVRQARAST